MPAPTITTLPTPPSRSTSPSTFATQADAFVAALPSFVTTANAQASYLDALAIAADVDAAVASAAATTAVNAAGAVRWVSGTTYASGAVVYSTINYQTYRRITAGAGTTDPSLDATNWAMISAVSGVSYASYTSIASTQQLVASDMGSVVLAASASGAIVRMPNATTLGSSQRFAVLKNTGNFSLMVQDFAGNGLLVLDPKAAVTLIATSISTTAGTWTSDKFIPSGVMAGPGLGYTRPTFDVELYPGIIARAVTGDATTTNPSRIDFLRDDDGIQRVISTSFPAALAGNASPCGICVVDTNKLAVFYVNNSGVVVGVIVQVDPNTFGITEGTAVSTGITPSIGTPFSSNCFLCGTHDTARLWFAYMPGTTDITVARGSAAVTGQTFPPSWSTNAIFSPNASTANGFAATLVDTNKLVLGWVNTSTNLASFVGIDLSAGVSIGSTVTATGTVSSVGLATFSTTQCAFAAIGTTTATYGTVTFSGTNTLTVSGTSSVTISSVTRGDMNVVRFGSASQLIAVHGTATGAAYSKLSVSGGVVTGGTITTLAGDPQQGNSGNRGIMLKPMSGNRASLTYANVSTAGSNQAYATILTESALV